MNESDKENISESFIDVETVIQDTEFLSKTPLVTVPNKLINIPNAFSGYHCFKAWVPEPNRKRSRTALSTYHVVNLGKTQKVYVYRARCWPVCIAFRPSVTPVDLFLRITPVFTYADRSNDVVERCKRHETKRDHSSTLFLKDRSLVEVVNICAEYVQGSSLPCCSTEQITVCIRLDVVQLLRNAKSHNTPSTSNSSTQNSQSCLLPEVQTTIMCRLSCYNSCFGLNSRGEIEFVFTLESRNNDPLDQSYDILGLEKLSVRCCSCPNRDVRQIDQIINPGNQEPSSENNIIHTDAKLMRRNCRRLSLNLSPHRNLRMGYIYGRQSCPINNNHQVDSADISDPSYPSICIDGTTYYLTLTDDLHVLKMFYHQRYCNDLSTGRWRGSNPDRIKKHIQKFYLKKERYLAECALRGMSFVDRSVFSQGSQESSGSVYSTADKGVGTDDMFEC